MVAVGRSTLWTARSANQAATLAESPLMGRVSLTLVYLIWPPNWWTKELLPPSIRCSMTTSHPRPSQPVNTPRSWSSISTLKWTVVGGYDS